MYEEPELIDIRKKQLYDAMILKTNEEIANFSEQLAKENQRNEKTLVRKHQNKKDKEKIKQPEVKLTYKNKKEGAGKLKYYSKHGVPMGYLSDQDIENIQIKDGKRIFYKNGQLMTIEENNPKLSTKSQNSVSNQNPIPDPSSKLVTKPVSNSIPAGITKEQYDNIVNRMFSGVNDRAKRAFINLNPYKQGITETDLHNKFNDPRFQNNYYSYWRDKAVNSEQNETKSSMNQEWKKGYEDVYNSTYNANKDYHGHRRAKSMAIRAVRNEKRQEQNTFLAGLSGWMQFFKNKYFGKKTSGGGGW